MNKALSIWLILLVPLTTSGQSVLYDSLAAADTLNWAQMQYLDSLVHNGGNWQHNTEKLSQLGVIKDLQEEVEHVPEHVQKLDSLLQRKSNLLNEEILRLTSSTKEDSLLGWEIPRFASDDLPHKKQLDALIQQYSGQLSSTKEITWLQDHLGQLQQIDGGLSQYQRKQLDLADLDQLQGYQQQLQEFTGQSQGYFLEVQGLFSGGLKEDSPLMQTLESKIGLTKEFQELQAQTAELEQFKALSQKYGADHARQSQQEAQQRLMAKAQEIGAHAFTEHQGKVQEVQDKFGKLKKKYRSLVDAGDLSAGVKHNSLKDEPFKKRLVIGGTMSITKDPAAADLSPTIGYRLNKQFKLGLGGTYRVQLDFDDLKTENQVYGWRSFMEYQPLESFFVHGEYETLSTALAIANTNGETTRHWVSGALAGVGKEYPFFKGVKGQVMVLYNFLYEHGESPYKKPWVIRFGFVL